jgi:hypothetical protein
LKYSILHARPGESILRSPVNDLTVLVIVVPEGDVDGIKRANDPNWSANHKIHPHTILQSPVNDLAASHLVPEGEVDGTIAAASTALICALIISFLQQRKSGHHQYNSS